MDIQSVYIRDRYTFYLFWKMAMICAGAPENELGDQIPNEIQRDHVHKFIWTCTKYPKLEEFCWKLFDGIENRDLGYRHSNGEIVLPEWAVEGYEPFDQNKHVFSLDDIKSFFSFKYQNDKPHALFPDIGRKKINNEKVKDLQIKHEITKNQLDKAISELKTIKSNKDKFSTRERNSFLRNWASAVNLFIRIEQFKDKTSCFKFFKKHLSGYDGTSVEILNKRYKEGQELLGAIPKNDIDI